jgi:hypothetical protein
MRHIYLVLISIVALNAICVGCKSTTSFFMSRHDNDRLAGNSNGHLGAHENAKPFKGIPVTMKIPTHVDVSVFETIYLNDNLSTIPTGRRNLRAAADVVYSDKIFAVDPKRAAAGNSNYTFQMNSAHTDPLQRQYFKQIKQHVEDETIRDINAALTGLLPLISKKAASPASGLQPEGNGTLSPPASKDRVVAWKRFDVNSPDFEEQVKVFVEHHINNCDACCQDAPALTNFMPTPSYGQLEPIPFAE